jgi:hypothetical protein
MPLPNSARFPKEAGPKRPPAQKRRYKSYSQAVKADRQVSLIHEHIKEPRISMNHLKRIDPKEHQFFRHSVFIY